MSQQAAVPHSDQPEPDPGADRPDLAADDDDAGPDRAGLDPEAVRPPDALLADYAQALVVAVDAVLAGWVVACVERRWPGGPPLPDDVHAAAVAAGAAARAESVPALRELFTLDAEQQRSGPLAVLRRAVAHPTAVLAGAGVPAARRDEFAERVFPADRYDLAPATWADIDPALHEPGLLWGAAKAHVVLTRRKGRP